MILSLKRAMWVGGAAQCPGREFSVRSVTLDNEAQCSCGCAAKASAGEGAEETTESVRVEWHNVSNAYHLCLLEQCNRCWFWGLTEGRFLRHIGMGCRCECLNPDICKGNAHDQSLSLGPGKESGL